jgi:hypothetical protein
LTPRLYLPPSTTIPPPNAIVTPIIVASAHSMYAIYRPEHRSIPIPARSNAHSFNHFLARAHTSYNHLQ